MGKFKNWSKQTVNIRKGDILVSDLCTIALVGIGLYLNDRLFKERIKNIDLEFKLNDREFVLGEVKKEKTELESKLNEK